MWVLTSIYFHSNNVTRSILDRIMPKEDKYLQRRNNLFSLSEEIRTSFRVMKMTRTILEIKVAISTQKDSV